MHRFHRSNNSHAATSDIKYRYRRRLRLFSRSAYPVAALLLFSFVLLLLLLRSLYAYVSDLCTIISTRISRPCACIILFDRLSDATRAGGLWGYGCKCNTSVGIHAGRAPARGTTAFQIPNRPRNARQKTRSAYARPTGHLRILHPKSFYRLSGECVFRIIPFAVFLTVQQVAGGKRFFFFFF